MEDRLTNQEYWRGYYSDSKIDEDKITSICSVYDRLWDILVRENTKQPPRSILEVGGYPGRYLAYLASKYRLVPTSIDFNPDKGKIEAVMKMFDVPTFDIITGDFLLLQPHIQFDIVISNGFIEHFKSYNEVLDKHVAYLKEGGTMLVMIPNKRWLRKWYGILVDNKNLKAHNLRTMHKQVFVEFANRNNLKLLEFTYHGGFAFNPHQKLNFPQRIIYQLFRQFFKRVNPFIEKYPNPFFSSTIVACFKK